MKTSDKQMTWDRYVVDENTDDKDKVAGGHPHPTRLLDGDMRRKSTYIIAILTLGFEWTKFASKKTHSYPKTERNLNVQIWRGQIQEFEHL